MTENTAAPVEHRRRKGGAWRPLAAAAAGGSVLLVTGFGVWASLNATASATQTVDNGTLKLTQAANGVGTTQSISKMAPGDVVNRFVTLTNGGTLAAKALTFKVVPTAVAPTSGNLLVSDAAKGLQLTVSSCTVAWGTDGSCAGTSAVALSQTAVAASTLQSGIALSNIGSIVSDTGKVFLKISALLPDQNETTVDGTLPSSTIQGASASLAYTFIETQRDATSTSS